MPNIVRNYAGKRIPKEGTVYVYGAGFSNTTKAWLGNTELPLKDYDYGWAEFTAVNDPGTYTLYVGSSVGNRKVVGSVVVCDLTALPIFAPKVPSRDNVRDAMLGLLPRGFAWYKGADGFFAKLMRGLAATVVELYLLAVAFKMAASPSHTDSFDTWENELRLPRFSSGAGDTDSQRRAEIFRINGKKGGCTVPYLKSILNLYGARYELFEYWKNSSVFPSWVARKYGEMANFCVLVKVYQNSYTSRGFTCKSKCTASLGGPNDYVMESILDQVKPAHVKILYRYFVRILTDMNGTPIVPSDEDQRMIIV